MLAGVAAYFTGGRIAMWAPLRMFVALEEPCLATVGGAIPAAT